MLAKNIPSFAKINLFLHVLSRFDNGYHKIATLFQSIGLHDELDIEITSSNMNSIQIECYGYQIPVDENNTMHKAINFLQAISGKEFSTHIAIRKNIPPGSGLGGGSSNAATILHACSILLNVDFKKNVLHSLATKIGADVSFFLYGGTALGMERGDKIIPCRNFQANNIIVVFPNFSLSTSEIYKKYDDILTENNFNNKISFSKKNFSLKELEIIAANDLEEVVLNEHAQIKEIKELLQKMGARISLMSGSGSALFGIFDSPKQVIKAESELNKMNIAFLVTETINRRTYWNRINRSLPKFKQ